jgi:hypothetical protein
MIADAGASAVRRARRGSFAFRMMASSVRTGFVGRANTQPTAREKRFVYLWHSLPDEFMRFAIVNESAITIDNRH